MTIIQAPIDISRIEKLEAAKRELEAIEAEYYELHQLSLQAASKTGVPKLVRMNQLLQKAMSVFSSGHPDNETDKQVIQAAVKSIATVKINEAIAPYARDLERRADQLRASLAQIASASSLQGPGIALAHYQNTVAERLGSDAMPELDAQVQKQVDKLVQKKLAHIYE